MDKKIWVIANWKSNKTISEALDWVAKVGSQVPKNDNLKVVVCPTFSALSEIKKAISVANFPLMVGSQDLSPFGKGAYTGEESAALIREFVDLAILGHSERRQNFGENDEMIAKKVSQALENNIIPLVCVQDEQAQVPDGCKLIAFDPSWAISTGLTNTLGSGKVANPKDANRVAGMFKQKYSSQLEVIYGGSVNSTNAKSFIEQENISGVLPGNASLDPLEFIKIIKECEG